VVSNRIKIMKFETEAESLSDRDRLDGRPVQRTVDPAGTTYYLEPHFDDRSNNDLRCEDAFLVRRDAETYRSAT
jgi:hypothetical protein